MAILDTVRNLAKAAPGMVNQPSAPAQQSTTQQVAPPTERNLDDYYTQNPGTSSAAAPTPIDAGTATATGFDATTMDLDPSKTASGRMLDITGQDSPLMQRAKQEGVLAAARRGLQNTSIAAGTAQGAMVDRAMPLAQQDAALYQAQQIENQRAANRAAEITSGRETEVDLSNVRAADQMAQFNEQLGTETDRFNVAETNQMTRDVMNQNAKIDLQGLTGNQSMDLQSMDDATKMNIAKHQTASSMYQSYSNAVASLFMNTSLTPERMGALVTGLKETLAGGAGFVEGMNNLDLTGGGVGRVNIPSGAAPLPQPAAPAPAVAPAPPPAQPYQRPFQGGFPVVE